jgi:hypothetical protein
VTRFKPTTPKQACDAIVWWMREHGFAHSFYEAYLQREPMKSDHSWPSGWGAHVDCSAKQVIMYKLGGCGLNCRYVQSALRSMNLPAVAFQSTGIPLPGQSASTGAARYYTNVQGGHTAVRCYTANVEMLHGDDALAMSGMMSGWYVCKNQSVWLPADAVWYLRQAIAESGDNQVFRQQVLAAVDAVDASGVVAGFSKQQWTLAVYGGPPAAPTPAATWSPAPNLAEQLLSLLSSPPAAFPELVPGGFATHFDVPPATTPFAATAGKPFGRLPQSLARTFAIATCPLPALPDLGFKGKLQPLGKSWAGHTLDAAWKVALPNPPQSEFDRLAKFARMFFMLDDRSSEVPMWTPCMGSGSVPALVASPTPFQTAFPGEAKQEKYGATGVPEKIDVLQRALFPTLAASSVTPIVPASSAKAAFDQTQPNAVAVAHIVTVAAHAALWWLLVRDPDYLPGTPAPAGFNPFA